MANLRLGNDVVVPQRVDMVDIRALKAVAEELVTGKELIAQAINEKGVPASADESLAELAKDVRDIPTSGVLSDGIVESEPFKFLDYVCKQGAHPFTEIDDDSVTIIDRYQCFYDQTNLLKVKMTALTTIGGQYTFSGCLALEEIEMPNLTTITGSYTFTTCSFQTLYLPKLTSIKSYIFSGCSSLETVVFPNITSMGSYPFRNCEALRNITFGTLTSLSEPFSNAKPNLRNITIGQDTNINLPFQNWTATNVIAEGQSAIDELNANLQTNLISKLYQGGNKILRLGAELYDVTTQETRDMVTAKGWTLQRG